MAIYESYVLEVERIWKMVKGEKIHQLFTNLQKTHETMVEVTRIASKKKKSIVRNKANHLKKKKRFNLAGKHKTFQFTCPWQESLKCKTRKSDMTIKRNEQMTYYSGKFQHNSLVTVDPMFQ